LKFQTKNKSKLPPFLIFVLFCFSPLFLAAFFPVSALQFWSFEFLSFGFVSDFVLRASCFMLHDLFSFRVFRVFRGQKIIPQQVGCQARVDR
jgi:hypothetical protein